MTNQPLPANQIDKSSDSAERGGGEFAIVVSGLQNMIVEQGKIQLSIAEINAKTEQDRIALERDRLALNGNHGKTLMRNEFAIKLAVFAILSGVVLGGFYTGNHGIVTHAATFVVGMIAGAGLIARKS